MSQVWFVTGASTGFGFEFVKVALEAGHLVSGCARKIEPLKELEAQFPDRMLAIQVDVTDRVRVFEAVKAKFGRIDVLISNAGYGHFGNIEEASEETMRQLMETNYFGSFNVIQAVLPIMRRQKSGHIFQVSSAAGAWAVPFNGTYCATKFAVEGLCESLSQEISALGIKVTIIEPGGYTTSFWSNLAESKDGEEDYKPGLEAFQKMLQGFTDQSGSPAHAAKIVFRVANMPSPPLRLALGKGIPDALIAATNARIADWESNKQFE